MNSVEKEDYSTMSVIDLTMELKSLSRKLGSLQLDQKMINPSTPEQFVQLAEIDEQIESINTDRTTIGKLLLAHQREREARDLEKLKAVRSEGQEAAKELLTKLESFAELIDQSFCVLATDYAELQKLADTVRKTNSRLLNARLPTGMVGGNHIEPRNLDALIKAQFIKSFGENAGAIKTGKATKDFAGVVTGLKELVEVIDED